MPVKTVKQIPLDILLLVISIFLTIISALLFGYAIGSSQAIIVIIALITLILEAIMIVLALFLVMREYRPQISNYQNRKVQTVNQSALIEKRSEDVSIKTEKPIIITLSSIERRIINVLREMNHLTQKEVAEKTGLSKSTISENLASLEFKQVISRKKEGNTKIVSLENESFI